MRIADDLIFSPSEITPERQEFSLSEMGLSVLGFQVSEMGTDATKVKGMRGPVVVATTPKERVATITLAVKGDADASLATAAYRLQQKLGQIEEVGDWLKRVPYVGDFAGPAVTQVKREVSLGNMGQWQAGDSPDVTFQLLIGSEWFDVDEEDVTEDLEVEQVGRATIVKVPPSRGTTPGLVRLRIKNSGEDHLRGLRQSMECRDAPADLEDPTALLAYNCADLTPKGVAEVKTVSGLEVVEATLTAGWMTVLDSEIEGVGHMTHAGPRRLWLRAQNPEEADAQLRLRYRLLGGTAWEENKIIPTPHHGGDYQYYDMGQVRTMRAKLGDQRWQFQVLARALSGSGKVRLHQAYPEPTEQYLVVAQPYVAPAADQLVLRKKAGTVSGSSTENGGTIEWKDAAKVEASDNSYATATGSGFESISKGLKLTNWGFPSLSGATILGVLVDLEVKGSETAKTVKESLQLVVAGKIIGSVFGEGGGYWGSVDEHRIYGGADYLPVPLTPSQVSDSGFGIHLQVVFYQSGTPVASVDSATMTVYYTEGSGEDRVCFAARSMDLRSEGVERQHPTDDVWGTLVPDGFLPYDPPGAVEGRPSRFLLIPSQGDFGDLADSGAADIEVEALMRRRAYHLAREASSY